MCLCLGWREKWEGACLYKETKLSQLSVVSKEGFLGLRSLTFAHYDQD